MKNRPANGSPFDIGDNYGENCSNTDSILDTLLGVNLNCKMEVRFSLAVDNALNGNIKYTC